jgi:sigma-70-like protein
MVSLTRLVRGGQPPATPAGVSGISATALALYERGARPALEALPRIERECIELTYFDGLGVAEVAARCAIDRRAVEDNIGRGLGRMLGYLSALAASGATEASGPTEAAGRPAVGATTGTDE